MSSNTFPVTAPLTRGNTTPLTVLYYTASTVTSVATAVSFALPYPFFYSATSGTQSTVYASIRSN